MKFNKEHLYFLKSISSEEQHYIGRDSANWQKHVFPEVTKIDCNLPGRSNRNELINYCQKKGIENMCLAIAVLSWGGMRVDHGQMLFKDPEFVMKLIGSLKNGEFESRENAFKAFWDGRKHNKLPGLGPSYYTKLICFLGQGLNGYIMDKWVGMSINLLTGLDIVKITNRTWVNDKNTPADYESYCCCIDELGIELQCSGMEAERKLFSLGGGKGEWRKYLKSHY